MRPVISYRCEGAGGGVGEGDHVVFGGISRRQQITRTDFDCRSTANEGRSLQSLRGVGEKTCIWRPCACLHCTLLLPHFIINGCIT